MFDLICQHHQHTVDLIHGDKEPFYLKAPSIEIYLPHITRTIQDKCVLSKEWLVLLNYQI